jgi:hypothetical protein
MEKMTELSDLVQKYEPVLRFSKDGEGEPEAFFPMSAQDYVHTCGLRRRKRDWEHLPGTTLLRHLGTVPDSGSCYLVYAAGDLPEDVDVDLETVVGLTDIGLELSRGPAPSEDAEDFSLEGLPSSGPVAPRVLVRGSTADQLEEQLAEWGDVERRSLSAAEMADLVAPGDEPSSTADLESAFDLTLPSGALESVGDTTPTEADLELAATELELLSLGGLAALPGAIRDRALEKYAPFLEWDIKPPVYHYHVSEDRGYRVLQYWFLYAYNDWAAHGGHNDHEADWEVVYVFLDDADVPQHVAYSRHVSIPYVYKPSTARWSEVERVAGTSGEATHPVVYVGCGSHASYLTSGRHRILFLRDFADGNDVSVGPGAEHGWGVPVRLTRRPWNLRFSGNWGALVKSWHRFITPGTEGPTGPARKGDKWRHPARWAGLAPAS